MFASSAGFHARGFYGLSAMRDTSASGAYAPAPAAGQRGPLPHRIGMLNVPSAPSQYSPQYRRKPSKGYQPAQTDGGAWLAWCWESHQSFFVSHSLPEFQPLFWDTFRGRESERVWDACKAKAWLWLD